jgi:hypothetical protein
MRVIRITLEEAHIFRGSERRDQAAQAAAEQLFETPVGQAANAFTSIAPVSMRAAPLHLANRHLANRILTRKPKPQTTKRRHMVSFCSELIGGMSGTPCPSSTGSS